MIVKVKEALQDIGLSKGEVDIYLVLSKFGPCPNRVLAKEAQTSSSKIYEVLDRLILKGLASYYVQDGVKYFNSTPADRLLDYLEEKKNTIENSQKEIKEILPLLKKQTESTNSESIIYRGKQAPKLLLKELIEIGKQGHEILGFGTDYDDWDIHYPAQLKEFIELSKKYKIKSRLLFKEGFMPKNVTAEVRGLKEVFISPVRTIIAGKRVYIVDFVEPITMFVIEKESVAKAYTNYFNLLWEQGKPVSK